MTTATHAALAEAVERLVTSLVHTPRLPGDDEPSELSTFQAIVLATLVDKGPQRLRTLAFTLGTTDATASRNIDALQRRGLATRHPDHTDGRAVIVSATEPGHETVRARRARLEHLVQLLVDRLGPTDGPRLTTLLTELRELLGNTE